MGMLKIKASNPKLSNPRVKNCTIIAGLTAGCLAFSVSAVTPVDLKDDRKAKSMGFDLIYEARDLDLPQNVRDGLTQARSSVTDTKKRVSESKSRITKEVLPYIEKAYWTEAKEALRLQVGTLRFDLNTLAETKSKAEKKAALSAKKQFFNDIEKVDFAIREKKWMRPSKHIKQPKRPWMLYWRKYFSISLMSCSNRINSLNSKIKK